MTEQGSDVLNVASFVHEMSSKRMSQDVWMRKALGNNTNKAAFNNIPYLLASEFRALLGDKEVIAICDNIMSVLQPCNKKMTAVIAYWDNTLFIALTNNTDSVIS